MGLVQIVFDDPEAAALAYFEQHLANKSAAALACAVAAARGPMIPRRPPPPGRGRAALSRPADADPRRQRGAGRLPRQAQAQLGAPLMATIPSVLPIVERCQALFDDLDLNAVKEWKAAAPGRKAIGYMPVYVPRELIHAAGMLSVGILGGGDQLEVIQGDAYYQSYICRIPRSTIELGLTGRLDCLDGMLFPSICDVIRNLSGHVADPVQGQVRPLHRRPAELRRRHRRRVLHRGARGPARRPRQAARRADHRRRAQRVDRGVQREPRRDPRPVRLPRGEAVAGADLRGLPRAARRHGAAARGAHAARPRLHRRGRRDAAAEARQRAHRADRRLLRAAAARPHQVDRDGGLLHRRRRLHAGDALAAGRRAGRPPIRSTNCRRPSCTARHPPPPSTRRRARKRACSC